METLKDTPFELGLFTWQVRPPQDTLVAVVKATFAIVPGARCAIADEQLPCTGEEPWDDDVVEPSLRFDTDLAVFKPVGEVFLHGACHPPGGRATASAVAFRFGEVHKQIAVFGDRVWTGARASSPTPFTAMPLRWERAYGGRGHALNPSGMGAPPVDGAPVRMLPNLEDPARLIRSIDDAPHPSCAAPITRTWHARASLAGTYDDRWKTLRFPWFPDDFDWRYFLSAPSDQRARAYWRGDEAFSLTNLRPDQSLVTGELPGLRPRLFTVLGAGATETFQELLLNLDTVTLDAEAMQIRCVWRGLLDVSSDRYEELTTLYVGHEPLDAPAEVPTWRARMEACRQRLLDDENPAPEAVPETAPPAPAALSSLDASLVAAGLATGTAVFDSQAPTIAPETPSVDLRADVIERLARGDSLAGADLTGADLSGLDLSQQDLAGTLFTRAKLMGARLMGSRLTEANLAGADLSGADLARAFMEKADLTGATLTSADLTEATLVSAVASEARMGGAVLYRANASGVDLVGAWLHGADLREAVFEKADLTGATLDDARCDDAVFRDAMASELIADGACFDRADLDDLRASDGGSFLRATFRGAKASRSKWHGAALDDADFSGSTLERADFQGASLVRARFDRCPMRHARLAACKLVDASLLRADLFEGSLEAADLTRADLRGANLHGVELWRAKLDDARVELAIVTRTRLEPSS